jgi:DNA-binding response OmpR family regulator
LAKILLVEDDIDLAEVLSFTLSSKGHSVQKLLRSEEAVPVLSVYKFDLIILDWMMPKVSGIQILKEYREGGGKSPILMLTAKSSVDDKESGLDAGADDYLTKPFHTKELLARVRALLRRPQSLSSVLLQAGDISLDPISCQVKKGGLELHLRPKVYSLLEFFMRHPDQVFSSDAILERVWMDDSLASAETVRTHIKLLRKAIGEQNEDSLIKNIRNRGYILPAGKMVTKRVF